MNKLTIGIIILIILAGGGYYLYSSRTAAPAITPAPAPAPSPAPATAPSPTPAAAGGKTHTISMDSNGFAPSALTIKAGDTVVFKNNDSRNRWPASAIHPTHQVCPGFDSLKPMASGETYSHTFTQAKECPIHDHLIPSLRGKIIVTE